MFLCICNWRRVLFMQWRSRWMVQVFGWCYARVCTSGRETLKNEGRHETPGAIKVVACSLQLLYLLSWTSVLIGVRRVLMMMCRYMCQWLTGPSEAWMASVLSFTATTNSSVGFCSMYYQLVLILRYLSLSTYIWIWLFALQPAPCMSGLSVIMCRSSLLPGHHTYSSTPCT